jgi:GNAT superfamily N-acetyltransferase
VGLAAGGIGGGLLPGPRRVCPLVQALLTGAGPAVIGAAANPKVRGRGIGRALLRSLEAEASRLGCDRVRLDTSGHLSEALPLYRSAGYQDTAPCNHNPYANHWLDKDLRGAKATWS